MRLLYYSSTGHGGLADYAAAQTGALARLGIEVQMLVPTNFEQRLEGLDIRPTLLPGDGSAKSVLRKRLQFGRSILENLRTMREVILREQHTHVLFGAFSEYLAPLWSTQLRKLRADGVVFGAVVHDPVRDYVVGPTWWHRYSIASAYSFLREAFVHEPVQLDTVKPMLQLRTTVIPHGPYQFPAPTLDQGAVRTRFEIPLSADVLLSFGHIRDGKNLHLVLEAMTQFPNTYLLVAGREQSTGQKPMSVYQSLAQYLGVGSRCRWWHEHIPASEIGNLFNAANVVLVTYSDKFQSASGVVNTAVHFRKLCLASSRGGNLRSSMEKYHLGVWVQPDSVGAIVDGLRQLQTNDIDPRWREYERENSWEQNATLVKKRMFSAE